MKSKKIYKVNQRYYKKNKFNLNKNMLLTRIFMIDSF